MKIASTQTVPGHILSAGGGAVAGGAGGAIVSGLLAQALGAKNPGVAANIGAGAGALAGGYAANRLADKGGPITRRLLNTLGGAGLGFVGAGTVAEAAGKGPRDSAVNAASDKMMNEVTNRSGSVEGFRESMDNFGDTLNWEHGRHSGLVTGASGTGGVMGGIAGALAPTSKEEEAAQKVASFKDTLALTLPPTAGFLAGGLAAPSLGMDPIAGAVGGGLIATAGNAAYQYHKHKNDDKGKKSKPKHEEEAEKKVAEILGNLTLAEARELAHTPYSHADAKMAMTLGFCDKLAEFGMTPSDMNALMHKKVAFSPVTEGKALISGGAGLATKATIGGVILAALTGSMTGRAHHSVERRMNKMDDAENVRLREKAKRLAAQRNELSEDLESRPTSRPPSTPAARGQKREIIQLLD